MVLEFPTGYSAILDKIDSIDPIKYGQTRNYINGAVTYLSPYISRGVISTKQVLQTIKAKDYRLPDIITFVKELCWRDYFQRVGQEKNLDEEIRQKQAVFFSTGIPCQILDANTGIVAIDTAIQQLYARGYMHNHLRMYTASLVCNIAKYHWRMPAQWMYYHLLDGDWASNACSWQWVAGANSNNRYFANQENINKFSFTDQHHTYLDCSYETLEQIGVPQQLQHPGTFLPDQQFPIFPALKVNTAIPTYIHNYYNLDPAWRKDEYGNRVLLLEPAFFKRYPVSKQCQDFMLALAKNIPDIQVYVGSFESLKADYHLTNIFYKEHPFNKHYMGTADSRDWIVPEVSGYYPSFSSYWKKIEKYLKEKNTYT